MLFVAIGAWSLSWNAPILDRHEFRQLQTAVSAHWLKQDGFRLNYETPLFGPPSWSIPMEFPAYQWCVARFSSFTGIALDQSGRTISILFFLATLPAVCGLAGLAGLTRPGRMLVSAAVLSSPVYLFYGRTFMIESTALCFATWFLFTIGLAVRDLSLRWSVIATLLGSLAALTKVTTFAVYCFPAAGLALWLGWPHWTGRLQLPSRVWRAALLCGVPVLVSTLLGNWWVKHADAVKDANPFSGFLKSSEMTAWNWGTLDQRFSLTVWSEVWSNIRQFVLSEPAVVVLIICAAIVTGRFRRLAAAGVIAFVVGPLLFANLYYRHDYYYSANALLLLGACGTLLAGMWNSISLPRTAKVLMLVLFFGAQLLTFYRGYAYNYRRELPEPPAIAAVIKESVPADGVVVIYGWDWNSLIPYYAQRRAIMIPDGREEELKVLEDILVQLPPRKVAALLIKPRTPTPLSPAFVEERVKRFGLVPTPFARSADGDLYLPAQAGEHAAAKLQGQEFPNVTLNLQIDPSANPDQLQINDLRGLDLSMCSPSPATARSKFGIKVGDHDGHRVIFAHPIAELRFNLPAQTKQINAEFGIVEAAYAATGGAVTDGVGFEIYEILANGQRRMLYQRILNPNHVAADRGSQKIQLKELGSITGDIIFRTNPGPTDNLVNDWAYWSAITLR